MIEIGHATETDLTYIDHLQKKNAEELAFYPSVVFEREIPNGRILLAKVNGEPAGYLYHGAIAPLTKIHQACIEYDLRGQLYGAELVRVFVSSVQSCGCASVKLRCGSDIAANGFWRAMGFYCQSVSPGGVRRMRDINEWRKDIHPQLFTENVEPSAKMKDATLWRKYKSERKSQFLRGAGLQDYREEILRKSRGEV